MSKNPKNTKTKKRKSNNNNNDTDDNAATDAASLSSSSSLVFLVAPGASGKDPVELRTFLSSFGETRSVGPKWKSNHPSGMNKNIALLKESIIETNQEYPNHEILLVGHSFGCRVIVALLHEILLPKVSSSDGDNDDDDDKNKKKKTSKKAKKGTKKKSAATAAEEEKELELPGMLRTNCAILESYPLYGPSKPKNVGTDRVIPLEELFARPKDALLKLLFVSGEKDEFLDRREWRSSSDNKMGGEALREIVSNHDDEEHKKTNTTCIVHMIENAKHNSLKVKKSEQEQVEEQLTQTIQEFLLVGDDDDNNNNQPKVGSCNTNDDDSAEQQQEKELEKAKNNNINDGSAEPKQRRSTRKRARK